MGPRVLIAEDDERLRAMLSRGLRYAGFEVFEAGDGLVVLEQAQRLAPDLVVLDIGMPGLDGLAVCASLRATSAVPILMLTARGEVSDRVGGLRGGADDYVVKPFVFQELVARLEALARRSGLMLGERLRFADLVLETETGSVLRAGVALELKPRERELLELLMRHPGQVLSATVIWERLWGEDRGGSSNALNVALSGLRRKLGAPELVETVRRVGLGGVGYRLREPAA
ncbi:response regulator transcription factor [Conexibacter sp. S30A1]|uniref:response regulator transcription factor n=1 Tax=Conexibacter sp. S30A1 TaxID=2937800 RepID=UPI00200EFACA|nr:response regulator transcription factor [Conexibacter sp. S30A1]